MATQISVTLDDIQHGERKSCTNCPVARAIGRHLPAWVSVEVGPLHIKYIGQSSEGFITTPHRARLFMDVFDIGAPVKPISFMLDLDPVFAAMEGEAA
jgi:hypothetical protein